MTWHLELGDLLPDSLLPGFLQELLVEGHYLKYSEEEVEERELCKCQRLNDKLVWLLSSFFGTNWQ